jgi:hypothetical protein
MPERAAPRVEPVHQRLRAWRDAAIAGHVTAAGEQPGVRIIVDGTQERRP